MPRCDILNRPYFIVPPEDPRVGLLFEQVKSPAPTGGFVYEAKDGRAFASPGVYFGTIVIYGDDAEAGVGSDARDAVLGACDGDDGETARIDFAWIDGNAFVLRAGVPGNRPIPFSGFGEEELAVIRDHVVGFMGRSYADVLMAREIVEAGDGILFEGEELFYEGFVGRDLMSLEVGAGAGGVLTCEGLAIAPEGSLAYEAICADFEPGGEDGARSSRDEAQGAEGSDGV